MSQSTPSDQVNNNNDAPQQKTAQDSQISTLAQLADMPSAGFSSNKGQINEQQTSSLNLQSMFAQGPLSDLAAGYNGTAGNSVANEFSTLGSEFTAVGKDLTAIGNDFSSLQSDVTSLLNQFQNTGGSAASGTSDGQAGGYGTTGGGGDVPRTTTTTGSGAGSDVPGTTTPGSTGTDTTGTTTAGGDGSGFAINNGQLQINGKLVNGIAVTGEYVAEVGAQQAADNIAAQFPGVDAVRLATSPDGGAFTNGTAAPSEMNQSVDSINQFIQALSQKGIGTIVDNHASDANTPNNVAMDGSEAAWFGQLAQDNIGNNMVMFQTENEPMGSDQAVVQEQQAAYQAIRATGSNAVVAFDLVGGGSASPMQSDPAAYNGDTNYVIDAHAYASNNPDPVSALQSEIAQTSGLTEANGGKVPVYIGETGNAIDGSNIDPAEAQLLNAVWSDGSGGVAWLYDGVATGFGSGNGADMMTNPDGSLSGYGEEIAGLIKQGAT